MSAATDCNAAFLAGVAQCQPVSMRFLLRGLKAKGFSVGQVNRAAEHLLATGVVRVVSNRRPYLYALPLPDEDPTPAPPPPLRLGPKDLPLTQQLLHTLERAGKGGATRAALATLYAARNVADAAVGCALVELHQRTHRVHRHGVRGAYVYVYALASVPGPRVLGMIEAHAEHTNVVALAPEWPAPPSEPALPTGTAPAWRIAA